MFNHDHDYAATASRTPQAKTRRLLVLATVACVAAWGAAAWAAFAQQTTVGPAITAQGQAKAAPALPRSRQDRSSACSTDADSA